MRSKLTTISVRNAKPLTGGRREIPDGGTGLYLVVHSTGRKSWALRYRAAGKPVKLTLGRVRVLAEGELEPADSPELDGHLTLGQARELTASLQRAIANGEDPAATKREAINAKPDTFAATFEQFAELHIRTKRRARPGAETERMVAKKVTPAWGDKHLGEIGRRDVVALLDKIVLAGTPTSANRTLTALRRFFNWCVDRGLIEISPCIGVKPPAPEKSRDRFLADDELAWIWKASDKLGQPFGQFIKLLILTGQRRDEVAGMRWSELDLDAGMWRLPRERVKNNTAHEVPLSAQTLTVLETLPRLAGQPDFVFTTGHKRRIDPTSPEANDPPLTPISGFSKAKAILDGNVVELRRKAAHEAGDDPEKLKAIQHWRLHDLRRTVATGMAKAGVSLPVIEKVLNHRSGSFAGIVGVYQQHSYAAEKRAALDAWASAVMAVGQEPAAGPNTPDQIAASQTQ